VSSFSGLEEEARVRLVCFLTPTAGAGGGIEALVSPLQRTRQSGQHVCWELRKVGMLLFASEVCSNCTGALHAIA
jgi:hypothetical protein